MTEEKREQTDKKQRCEQERHRCIKCESKFGYLRLKDKHWCCRTCGYIDGDIKGEME